MTGRGLPAILAAGGLLWQGEPGSSKLALVHRPRHGDWSLPKGKLEPRERWQDAALREVREETGCHAELGEFAGVVLYEFQSLPKIVLYWNMTLQGAQSFTPTGEVDEVAWLDPEAALARLDHADERTLVSAALRDR